MNNRIAAYFGARQAHTSPSLQDHQARTTETLKRSSHDLWCQCGAMHVRDRKYGRRWGCLRCGKLEEWPT